MLFIYLNQKQEVFYRNKKDCVSDSSGGVWEVHSGRKVVAPSLNPKRAKMLFPECRIEELKPKHITASNALSILLDQKPQNYVSMIENGIKNNQFELVEIQ